MGNAGCLGRKANHKKYQQNNIDNQSFLPFILIWLDNEQKTNSKVKYYLKQIDQHLIKFDDNDSCETYIRERPNGHFSLVVCHKLGNILVPEIDELPQLDSVFIYDFSSNVVLKLWMQECKKVTNFFINESYVNLFFSSKITNDVFTDLDQLQCSIKDRILSLNTVYT